MGKYGGFSGNSGCEPAEVSYTQRTAGAESGLP